MNDSINYPEPINDVDNQRIHIAKTNLDRFCDKVGLKVNLTYSKDNHRFTVDNILSYSLNIQAHIQELCDNINSFTSAFSLDQGEEYIATKYIDSFKTIVEDFFTTVRIKALSKSEIVAYSEYRDLLKLLYKDSYPFEAIAKQELIDMCLLEVNHLCDRLSIEVLG